MRLLALNTDSSKSSADKRTTTGHVRSMHAVVKFAEGFFFFIKPQTRLRSVLQMAEGSNLRSEQLPKEQTVKPNEFLRLNVTSLK